MSTMSNTDKPPSQGVIIALMGPTGTGKSTFINLLTNDENIRIGHDLHSHTFDVNTARLQHAGVLVTFADTPGFDDSREGITDTDILGKIVSFLQGDGGRKVNGIIYLHRISDPRMGGTTKKNLRMFMGLCGDNNFGHVRIVTTNWKRVDETEGRDREAELANGAFKPLIDHGAQMLRHDRGFESAQAIVSQLAQMTPVKLKIQEELNAGRALGDTSAGAVIIEEMKEIQKKQEKDMADLKKEMEEAESADEELKAELAAECRKLEEMMALAERDRKTLLEMARQKRTRAEEEERDNLVEEMVFTTGNVHIVSETAPGPHAGHKPVTLETGLTLPSSKTGDGHRVEYGKHGREGEVEAEGANYERARGLERNLGKQFGSRAKMHDLELRGKKTDLQRKACVEEEEARRTDGLIAEERRKREAVERQLDEERNKPAISMAGDFLMEGAHAVRSNICDKMVQLLGVAIDEDTEVEDRMNEGLLGTNLSDLDILS